MSQEFTQYKNSIYSIITLFNIKHTIMIINISQILNHLKK
jgi:hypothetical protein